MLGYSKVVLGEARWEERTAEKNCRENGKREGITFKW